MAGRLVENISNMPLLCHWRHAETVGATRPTVRPEEILIIMVDVIGARSLQNIDPIYFVTVCVCVPACVQRRLQQPSHDEADGPVSHCGTLFYKILSPLPVVACLVHVHVCALYRHLMLHSYPNPTRPAQQ